jgi:hypothetical protein
VIVYHRSLIYPLETNAVEYELRLDAEGNWREFGTITAGRLEGRDFETKFPTLATKLWNLERWKRRQEMLGRAP